VVSSVPPFWFGRHKYSTKPVSPLIYSDEKPTPESTGPRGALPLGTAFPSRSAARRQARVAGQVWARDDCKEGGIEGGSTPLLWLAPPAGRALRGLGHSCPVAERPVLCRTSTGSEREARAGAGLLPSVAGRDLV